jgi:hypothetical protein
VSLFFLCRYTLDTHIAPIFFERHRSYEVSQQTLDDLGVTEQPGIQIAPSSVAISFAGSVNFRQACKLASSLK